MATSWIVEIESDGGEHARGPYKSPFEAISARADIDGPTLLYIATEDRRTVVEMDERSEARPLAGLELAAAISMLQYLEERERWNLPVWKDSPWT